MRTLATLASPPPLVSLEWHGANHGSAVADFAAMLPRIPTLRRFSIRGPGAEELAWAWRGSTIRELAVEAPSERLAHWLDLAVAERLDRLDIRHDGWSTTLRASGAFTAQQGYSGTFEHVLPHLEAALDRPAVAAMISQVEIRVSAKHEWKLAARRLMAGLLARHPRWAAGAEIYGYAPPG